MKYLVGVDADPEPITRRWPDPVSGPLTLRLWFGTPRGYPAVVGVEMWGVEPKQQAWDEDREGLSDAPVTAAAIRLPLGKMLDAWVALHRNAAQTQPPPPEIATLGPVEDLRKTARQDLLETTRQTAQALFLRQVAGVYEAALNAGNRRPAKAVEEWAADREGGPFSPSTVRSWIKRAADRGYLPRSSQGKVRREQEQS